MTILRETINTVKDFEIAIQTAKDEFFAAQKKILDTYKAPASTEKLAEARAILTEIEIRETRKAREVIQNDFATVRNIIADFVNKSLPDDFVSALAAIQAKGEKITDYEAECILKKYKGNYMAFSTILNALNKCGKSGNVYVLIPDNINEKIDSWEKRTLNWIQNRAGVDGKSDYMTRLITSDKSSPLLILANEIEKYINGGFILDNSVNPDEKV